VAITQVADRQVIESISLTSEVAGTLPVGNGGTGQTTLTALPLTTPTITGYIETVNALGTVGATNTIAALSNGTVVTATLTSATACTFTMPTATAGQSFVMILKQPASGTATTATFTGVKWPAGTAPTITATVGRCDILAFLSDGTNWYGSFNQNYTY
jgi:hypothetical protein